MITWNCKPATALSIAFMLSACEGMDTGTGLLASLASPDDAALPAVPLTQASMMRGNVTLVPPSGYCIDADSLTQSFALMARCDALGAATGGFGAPAGILTVSLSRSVKNAPLPTAQEIATSIGLSDPQNVQQADASVVFQTSGTAPAPNLSSQHWRSVSQVDHYTMGAALFGQKGRRAVSNEGASVLQDLIKRTTDTTNAS